MCKDFQATSALETGATHEPATTTAPVDWECACEPLAAPAHSDGMCHTHDHIAAALSSHAEGSCCDADDANHAEWQTHTAPADKPAKGRKPATKGAGCKPQRMCMYEQCPSAMHSSKWRVVTATTVAGGRDWQPLFGMTLCDSCYSTYRKHGTFIRSVRTPEGWARFDHSAQTHILNKPSKKRVAHASGPAKRARPAPSGDQAGMVASVKRNCRVVIDEQSAHGIVEAGRPKRERKPSAKLREIIAPDGDDCYGAMHEDRDHGVNYTDDYDEESGSGTPDTTPAQTAFEEQRYCQWPDPNNTYHGDMSTDISSEDDQACSSPDHDELCLAETCQDDSMAPLHHLAHLVEVVVDTAEPSAFLSF